MEAKSPSAAVTALGLSNTDVAPRVAENDLVMKDRRDVSAGADVSTTIFMFVKAGDDGAAAKTDGMCAVRLSMNASLSPRTDNAATRDNDTVFDVDTMVMDDGDGCSKIFAPG